MTARRAVTVARVLFISAMTSEDAGAFDALLAGRQTPDEMDLAAARAVRRSETVGLAGGDVVDG